MPQETVAIGADHAGYELKAALSAVLKELGFLVLDLGTNGPDSVDYPDFANAVSEALTSGAAQYGVLVCGSGIGMSIAANRHGGVRAALCHDNETAQLAREHNDANVLVLGSRTTDPVMRVMASWFDDTHSAKFIPPMRASLPSMTSSLLWSRRQLAPCSQYMASVFDARMGMPCCS